MKVQLKNNTKMFDCTEPTEQKVFRSGIAIGWAIMFSLYGSTDSSETDDTITPEAIAELNFTNDSGETFTICGYTAVTSCVIRHKEAITITELQLTKANAASDTEGATNNG